MSGIKTSRRLSLKRLESHLQELDDFELPKLHLEQYATPAHIAAQMLNCIDQTYDDLSGKFVADLGCGTGRLTVGSLLCGAQMVLGFDVDREALDIGIQNIHNLFVDDDEEEEEYEQDANDEYCDGDKDGVSKDSKARDQSKVTKVYHQCERFNLIQADVVSEDSDKFWNSLSKKFDTVVMNPPFGTKFKQGLDMIFLKRAIDITNNVVYSLHKSSTRDHILKQCREWGVQGKPLAQIRYNLDKTYNFHKKNSVDIEVDLWRVSRPKIP